MTTAAGPSAAEIAAGVASGALSARDVVGARLARISEVDPMVRALVRVDAEGALQAAARIDRARAAGRRLGPLAGVPYVLKDNIDVGGEPTTAGSRATGEVLALRDAVLVRRLRAAGAILLGRANMDEFAMGASTGTSAFGPTHNPWDLRRSPGGSSGGSAAAVAAGLAPLAVGTDTGGSIREPAAQCGVVGLAPTPDLVPPRGVLPFAPELDRVGPIAATVTDAALLLGVLSRRPPTAGPESLPARPRLGVVSELCGPPNRPDVLARLQRAQDVALGLGWDLVEVSIPSAAAALPAYSAITSAACVASLRDHLHPGLVGAEVLRRWRHGQWLLDDGYELRAAEDFRRRLTAAAAAALADCDALLSPTMPTTAPILRAGDDGDRDSGGLDDPLAPPYTDCWTVVANLAGLAAVSVPAGLSAADQMPVGVQLAAGAGSDGRLLALARALTGPALTGPALTGPASAGPGE